MTKNLECFVLYDRYCKNPYICLAVFQIPQNNARSKTIVKVTYAFTSMTCSTWDITTQFKTNHADVTLIGYKPRYLYVAIFVIVDLQRIFHQLSVDILVILHTKCWQILPHSQHVFLLYYKKKNPQVLFFENLSPYVILEH